MKNEYFDVAIIGCGPGGATAAVEAREAGLSVLVIEKEQFPRFHIGESLTGMAGNMLRDMGVGPQLDALEFPKKSGVKVIGKDASNEYFVPVLSPTWQVKRDDFDKVLMDKAIESGAIVRQGSVTNVLKNDDAVVGLEYLCPEGTTRQVKCETVIDASGMSCVLSRLKVAGDRFYDAFKEQIAVFTQIEGAIRDPGEMGDNTFIFYSDDMQWAWFIPLSKTSVSVGIVVPKDIYAGISKDPEAVFDWGVDNLNPELTRRIKGKKQIEEVRAIRDYSYRIEPFAGKGWFCIGDAHRFADPIFSFGVTASMTEAKEVVKQIELMRLGKTWQQAASDYADYSNVGQQAIYDFVSYFWKYPTFFGYQLKSKMRKDVIKLFGGDIFKPNSVVDVIREELYGEMV